MRADLIERFAKRWAGKLRALASRWNKLLTESGVKRWLPLTLPIVVLLADIIAFPIFIDRDASLPAVRLDELLAKHSVVIGRLRGHELIATLDDVNSERFLVTQRRSTNGLVVSLFKKDGRLVLGPLARAVLGRLEKASPEKARDLKAAFNNMHGLAAGDAAAHRLHLSEAQHGQFPLSQVFAVVLGHGAPNDELLKQLSTGMASAFVKAGASNVEILVIPCLGHNWNNKDSIDFETCFEPIVKALRNEARPKKVHISLYNEWPTYVLENAVGSMNHTWTKHIETSFGRYPLPFRAEFRITLLALTLCLWVCGRVMKLNARNTLIVSIWFISLSVGLGALLDFLTQGYDPALRLFLRCIVLLMIALGVRYYVHLGPKEVVPKPAGHQSRED